MRKSIEVLKYRCFCVTLGAIHFWIDVPLKEFNEKKVADLNLFSKRILGRLLVFLIINANEAFTPMELFEHVWCLEPNGLNEDITVRTSISRLRNIIEPSPPHWQYIKKTHEKEIIMKKEFLIVA